MPAQDKPRRGRPPLDGLGKGITVCIVLHPDLVAGLDACAAAKGCNRSEFIRAALQRTVARSKK